MTIIDSLHRARRNSGQTLRAVASTSGIDASNLSRIESGHRDATTHTTERLADAVGIRFLAVERTHLLTAAIAADIIGQDVAGGQHSDAYREFIQLADDLASADAFTRVLLSAEEPDRSIGRWYDAIAALVELRLTEAGAPLPRWVRENQGNPDELWVPPRTASTSALTVDVDELAEPFRRRGIGVEAGELESV